MRDGIGNQSHAGFRRDLFHDLRLAHAGGTHQQNRPLTDRGDLIIAQRVTGQIRFQRVRNLRFRLFDIHAAPPFACFYKTLST